MILCQKLTQIKFFFSKKIPKNIRSKAVLEQDRFYIKSANLE